MSTTPQTAKQTALTASNGECFARDMDSIVPDTDNILRCGAPTVATVWPRDNSSSKWRFCEHHVQIGKGFPSLVVKLDSDDNYISIGTCTHAAHAHPDAPCPDKLSIVGALPPPGHADYGCQVPLPDTTPILVNGVGAGGAGPLTITAMDGASAAQKRRPCRPKAEQVIAAKALYGVAEAERDAQEADAAFRARAEAAGWTYHALKPATASYTCGGCNRHGTHGAVWWENRLAGARCPSCLRAHLDSRDATGGFVPGNASGGWPFDATCRPDEAAIRAVQAAPPPPKPEFPMLAKGGIRDPSPTPRTDDSPTEACVPFPPAPPKFERRDPTYCNALCGAPATINGVFVEHTPHTALCDAKHIANGGTITCPTCGCTDEYELFSSHGRCEFCQIALCIEAVRLNNVDREAEATEKAIRDNPPPERYPPRGWNARYSVFDF